MMKILLAQVQGTEMQKGVPQYNPSSGVKLGQPGMVPKWGSSGKSHEKNCSYCSYRGHFIPECDEVKEDINNRLIKVDADGKLRLIDGGFIPNMPNVAMIKERVKKYYARKQSQYWVAMEEEDNTPKASTSQYSFIVEDPLQ